jgi:hypothetical protein
MAMSQPETGRNVTVDFWRGLALCTIFINHVPGNLFERFTHRNLGFSDATEIFVLLAGVAAAFAYLPKMVAGRLCATSFRILLRAFQLYMAHIVLVVACCAMVGYAVSATGDTRFLQALHLDVLTDNTVPALIGLVLLGLQPAYLNILPLYIVLLLATPVLLMLVRRSGPLALAASGAIYVASQLYWINLPTFPEPGWWFLNPLAWQFLFVIGLVLGKALLRTDSLQVPAPLFWASLTYLAISLVWIRSGFYPTWNLAPLPLFLWEFDKTNLFAPRLLHVLALLVVFGSMALHATILRSRVASALAVLGRHSLPVFFLGTLLALSFQILRALSGGGLVVDTVLIGSGLAAQFALAGVLEWHRNGTRRSASSAFSPSSSAR